MVQAPRAIRVQRTEVSLGAVPSKTALKPPFLCRIQVISAGPVASDTSSQSHSSCEFRSLDPAASSSSSSLGYVRGSSELN